MLLDVRDTRCEVLSGAPGQLTLPSGHLVIVQCMRLKLGASS